MTAASWRIKGEEVNGCNCAWGCPCQFNALPTHGRCEGFMAVLISEGHFGTVSIADTKFAMAVWFPGPIHEGNGAAQVIVDAGTPEQRDALLALTSGQHGGTMFEILAAVASRRQPPLERPIDIESDRERRLARLSIPGVIEYRAEPIRNPISGEEHRAQIRLPNGFEYREAEMANTTWLRVTAGEIDFEHRNTYAQLNAVDWSHEAV